MASIKLGSIASDIRGSIGGTVFSRNGGGAYAKQRIKGTNPNTAGQQLVRSIVSGFWLAWSLLTAAVRTDWATYAANITLVNRLGDNINISGYNMYCRTKAIIERLGLTMPAAAPTTMALPSSDPSIAVTPSAGGKTLSITFNNAMAWANQVGGELIIYQGRPQNATKNSYSGPFNIIAKIDGAISPPTTPAVVPSLYAMGAGEKVFCQFRILMADGRLSNPFRTVGTVGA
jgi:hypothetical protein